MASRSKFLPALGLLLIAGPAAEARTFTSADGRTIEADIVRFEGTDKVTIKRTDTGQTFTLPIASFAERDRAELTAEAEAAARKKLVLPPNSVAVEFSRVRVDTRKEKQDISLSNGEVRQDGITIIEDDWAYSVTLRNLLPRPIESLRADYILFVKVDNPSDTSSSGQRLRRVRESLTFDPIPVGGRVSARTASITTRKRELADGVVWSGSLKSKARDSLYGVWLRLYQGDTLVHETVSPTMLTSTEEWADTKPKR